MDWAQRILHNQAVLAHYGHSRTRVYPQDVGATITLVADAAADTFGNWTQIVPINTIDFEYEVPGLVVEAANAATTYLIQLGFSLLDGSDPTIAQITGERRILLPSPIVQATEVLHLMSQDIPANAKLWGRVKSASLAADQLQVSVKVTRHLGAIRPIPKLPTWPWAT